MMQLVVATVLGALTSALLFTRAGLRPWQSLPIGLGVQIVAYLALRLLSRRRGS
jgi:hypothetical protein